MARVPRPELNAEDPRYFVIGPSDQDLRQQGVIDPGKRRLLRWAGLGTAAAVTTYVFFDALRIVKSVQEFFGVNSEMPKPTGIVSELTVDLSALNIRTYTMRTENIDRNDHSNEIPYFDIDSLGREANGSGRLKKFDPDHPTLTLKNVPITSGYNPDTGARDTGVWLWVPAKLKAPLTIPPSPIALEKEGWVCFSLSQQTSDAISIPPSALNITQQMNPSDPRVTEVVSAK